MPIVIIRGVESQKLDRLAGQRVAILGGEAHCGATARETECVVHPGRMYTEGHAGSVTALSDYYYPRITRMDAKFSY